LQKLVERSWAEAAANGIARSRDEAVAVASRIGYPVLMRPSYVLGGRAMEIVDAQAQLEPLHRHRGAGVGRFSPVLIDQYLRDAIEVDVDALCDGDAVSWSRASCSISRKPASIRATAPAPCRPTACRGHHRRDRAADRCAGAGAEGRGLMNVQFAVKGGT
jgi:carbamoyl-phosphate synthase large subunit